MRIIGGKHKSRILKQVNAKTTRSTSDNVKEAVFNMLEIDEKMVVLDLFSGAGSYGLEAISRGAGFAYFNDLNQTAYLTTIKNIKSLKEAEKTKVTKLDYKKALNFYQKSDILFDLIFLDPPYQDHGYEELLEDVYPVLKKAGLIVLEMDKHAFYQNNSDYFTVLKDRTYGRKRILILINN